MIGKFYNSSTLGYYSKALETERHASVFISSVLDQVCYPVLSEAQNDKIKMITILKHFIGMSAYVTFPIIFLLILLAKPIFILLYSERWVVGVPYFQVLCLAGLAICLQNINYYAIAAIGKSKELFNWTLIKRISGLILVFAGLWLFGIYGLLWGTVGTYWLIYVINSMLVSKYVGYTGRQQLSDLFPIVLASVISFVITYLIGFSLTFDLYIKSIIQFVLFVFVYLFISVTFKIKAFQFTKVFVSDVLYKYHRH